MTDAEEPLETELLGATMGNNPVFGAWRHSFHFPPVSHAANGERRTEFKKKLRDNIDLNYLFIDEVKVDIQLYLNAQKVRETDATADVDNYAKGILDCLKGSEGVIIDDCQIQSLHVSWMDRGQAEDWFEVEISGHPDEFCLKNVALYEMPNGLWYPLSDKTWDKGRSTPLSETQILVGPQILEEMTGFEKKFRAEMRRLGMSPREAYQYSTRVRTLARGFHKSRVVEEFSMVPRAEWKAAMETAIKDDKENARQVSEILCEYRQSMDALLEAHKKSS